MVWLIERAAGKEVDFYRTISIYRPLIGWLSDNFENNRPGN